MIPDAATPFLATISPSCSGLAAILAFGAIAVFLVRGEPGRRVLAFLAAAGLIMVCNLLRIGLSIWVGIRTDVNGLTFFHDWVGTAFGLIYVLGGLHGVPVGPAPQPEAAPAGVRGRTHQGGARVRRPADDRARSE